MKPRTNGRHPREPVNREPDSKLPPLTTWTKQSLAERDWNFTDFCRALEKAILEIPTSESPILSYRAFTWEVDRELGSGNEPFDLNRELATRNQILLHNQECRLTIMRQDHPTVAVAVDPPLWLFEPRKRNQPLNEWHLSELVERLPPDTVQVSRETSDICALEIPWVDDEDEIVESFRSWLRKHRGCHVGKAGRKHEWRTWFINLAIYRLSIAGYTRTEVLKMIRIQMSAPNFARAKRSILHKVKRRFAEMCHSAKYFAERLPDRSHWSSHFLKQ